MMAERSGAAVSHGTSRPESADHSVLVVVGALRSSALLERLLRQIDRGVRCWAVDLDVSVLDQQLKLFVSRHSAFLSEDVPGQRTLQHRGDVLDTQVLVNPVQDFVCSEVRRLVCDSSRHKLLVLVGQCVEESGDIVLQKGSFSLKHFLQIFTDEEVGSSLNSAAPSAKASLTLSCPDHGLWKESVLEKHNLQDFIKIYINPPAILPEMEGLQEFTEYLSESLEPESPFDLLEPPSTVGFLKLSRPCCYIFPGGRGDSAFFAVNGFNVLVNGGSDPRSCFWKLVRHLDRIDSVLLTHVGVDNLPGVNSLLLRKVSEQEGDSAGAQTQEDRLRNLISPEIGVVFFNVPERMRSVPEDPSVLRSCDQVALALQNMQRLELQPEPLSRMSGPIIEPVILFQKMGVGRLELYTLNPIHGSKDYEAFLQIWPKDGSTTKRSSPPLPCLASICALLVWHPSSPQEKIIRVLFPGCTPQTKVLDGLEKLKHLEFLKHPSVCLKDLEKPKTEKPLKRAESRESLKSNPKDLRPASASQKVGRADVKKQEVKVKPRVADGLPKDKIEEDKSNPKDGEVKTKLQRPAEKAATKKDEKKEVKKKEDKTLAAGTKKDEAGDKKKELSVRKESAKPKKEAKAEPKRETKKEVKTEEKKATRPAAKEVKKNTGATVEPKKTSGKIGSLKKDGTLPKKEALIESPMGPTTSKEGEKEILVDGMERLGLEDDNGNLSGVDAAGKWTSTVESPETFRCVEGNQHRNSSPLSRTPTNQLCALQLNENLQNTRPESEDLVSPAHFQDHHQDLGSSTNLLSFGSIRDLVPDSPPSPRFTEVSSEQVVPSTVSSAGDSFCSNGNAVDTGMQRTSHNNNNNGIKEHIHGMSDVSSDVPHHVDLCLVSPCEFQHPKTPERSQLHVVSQCEETIQETSTSDCASITADSEEDSPAPKDHHSLKLLPSTEQPSSPDPPPAPVKDLPPLPARPGACMADSDADGPNRSLKGSSSKTRRPVSLKVNLGSTTAHNGKFKAASSSGSLRTTSSLDTKPSTRSSLGGSKLGTTKPLSSGSKVSGFSGSSGSAVYLDLAYLPSGGAWSSVDVDFFRRVRSTHYVVSGDDPLKETWIRGILDSLLEGKSSWPDVQVTLIPTFDSLAMHEWYQESHDRQRELCVTVLGSNSTVAMQEETFPACKVEF